jgi:hypothetical protein
MTPLPVPPAVYLKLRRRGAVFWLDDGRPYCAGPPGVVTLECLTDLRDYREQLIAFLTVLESDINLQILEASKL